MFKKLVYSAIILLTLISSSSFASDPIFNRSSEGKSIFLNFTYIEGCAKGYAAASVFETENQGLKPNREGALDMAKAACVDDTSIVSIYNAMRNGGDVNSLSDAKKIAEKRVTAVFNIIFDQIQSAKKN